MQNLNPEQLAARLWVEAAVDGRPLADLPAIREGQLEDEKEYQNQAEAAADAAAWLVSLGQAAKTFLAGPEHDARGIVIARGPRLDWKYSEAPYMRRLAAYGDEDKEGSLVTVWEDMRLFDVLGEDASTADEAFRFALHKLDVAATGGTTVAEHVADTEQLAYQMAATASARARSMSSAAAQASARAEAVTWKRGNPAEPARGLTSDQADLIVALCITLRAYRTENDGRAPTTRVKLLDRVADGPLKKPWKKERAINVAGTISIHWPLSGGDGSSDFRQLYEKGKAGRLKQGQEEIEAQVLVEGVEYLRPLAEQVFAESLSE